ncbi:MAG: hypothetical protein MH137_10030 [Flavobacteriales bacterium]|nr:hypothetical protein [Flavobacteriales bacterium]
MANTDGYRYWRRFSLFLPVLRNASGSSALSLFTFFGQGNHEVLIDSYKNNKIN